MVDEKVENAQRLVEKLLISDDSDGLIVHLRFGDVKLPHQYILARALLREAYNCVDVLLRLKLDLNNILPFCYATPLQIAAERMNPHLVEACLRHGANPDDGHSPEFKGMKYRSIPLEVACRSLRTKLEDQWNADQPIFKLIIILCLPQMRDSLETIRLLLQVSKEANEVLYDSAQIGSLIELAIYLMVIREKVLGDCIPFRREIGFGLNGDMRKHLNPSTIHCVVAENKMLDGHWHDFSDTQLLMMYEQLKPSADSLLQVFEKAGCAIEKYLKLQDPDVSEERVIGDVTLLLLEAGFSVKPEDVNLSDINRCVIGGTIKLLDKKSERNIHTLPHIRIIHKVWWQSGVENAQRLVEKLLISDDSDGLIVHLIFGDVKLPHQYILDRALLREAYNCVDVLLRRKLDLNNILPFCQATPLQVAAETLNPHLVEAFLRHGANPDDGYSPDFDTMKYCSIPLEVACRSLRNKLEDQWSADQPIFKLIIILCLPQMRDSLETIRLLVQVSKDANEVLYESAQIGSLIELAIYLMVIREKVLGDCIPFRREIGFGLNGGMRKHLKPSTIDRIDRIWK